MEFRVVRTQLTYFDASDRTWQIFYAPFAEEKTETALAEASVSHWALHRRRTQRALNSIHLAFDGLMEQPAGHLDSQRIRGKLGQDVSWDTIRALIWFHQDRLPMRGIHPSVSESLTRFLDAIAKEDASETLEDPNHILDLASVLAIPFHWDVPGCFALNSLRALHTKTPPAREAWKFSQPATIFAYVLTYPNAATPLKGPLTYPIEIDYAAPVVPKRSAARPRGRPRFGTLGKKYYGLKKPLDHFAFCFTPPEGLERHHYRLYAALIDGLQVPYEGTGNSVYVINYPFIVSGFRHHIEFYVQPKVGNGTPVRAIEILAEWDKAHHPGTTERTVIKESFRELILGLQSAAFRARALDNVSRHRSAGELFAAYCNQLFHMKTVLVCGERHTSTARPTQAMEGEPDSSCWRYDEHPRLPYMQHWSRSTNHDGAGGAGGEWVNLDPGPSIELIYEDHYAGMDYFHPLFHATSLDQLERHFEWSQAITRALTTVRDLLAL